MKRITDIIQGDLLTFKATDNKYKVLLCTNTYKKRSPYYYNFAALTYDSLNKPAITNILDSEFLGIGNRKNDYFKYPDIVLDKMWAIHPETKPYYLGCYGFTIWRKDFMTFQHNFEIIGTLKIVDNLDKHGNRSVNASSWIFLNHFFSNNYLLVLGNWGQKPFKLKSIIID